MDAKLTQIEFQQYVPKDEIEREALDIFHTYLEMNIEDLKIELEKIKKKEDLENWVKDQFGKLGNIGLVYVLERIINDQLPAAGIIIAGHIEGIPAALKGENKKAGTTSVTCGTSLIGLGIGLAIGGPIGGAIGGTLGGLIGGKCSNELFSALGVHDGKRFNVVTFGALGEAITSYDGTFYKSYLVYRDKKNALIFDMEWKRVVVQKFQKQAKLVKMQEFVNKYLK